jgi:hypothetical protein
MQPFGGSWAALAVALIFYLWKTHCFVLRRRQRVLRERIAYMLWVTADRADRCPYYYPISTNETGLTPARL